MGRKPFGTLAVHELRLVAFAAIEAARNALVRRALRDWSRDVFTAIGASIEDSKRRKMVQSTYNTVSSPGIEFDMLRHDKEAMDFYVTRCPFAEFFPTLGEPELGALLICETDFDSGFSMVAQRFAYLATVPSPALRTNVGIVYHFSREVRTSTSNDQPRGGWL
jgi:hypothetical protein